MECLNGRYLHKQDMIVPCGNCAFCAATRRSDWATRLHYEARLHYGSKFVSMTYADAHLSWKEGRSQLVKSDLQKWFKRVRKAGYKFRYYAVGEYGAKTFRPHYHVILFGDVPDEVIKKAWPFGYVHIGKVTQASINYCLGYLSHSRSWKMVHHRSRPFTIMSRGDRKEGSPWRYGLGHSYLRPGMIEWHRSGRKNYVLIDGEKRHLPRYYKTRIFSKIDLVRIAVRDQKAMFRKMVEQIRTPSMMRLKDPLSYIKEQRERAAKRLRRKFKDNLTI